MLKLLLYPLSLLYGLVVSVRNKLYDFKLFKSREFDIPVISIGNITVGGTGKTPHTEYLIKLLKQNYRVAALSRGYKRKSQGFRLVDTSSMVEEVGDEPLQMKRKYPGVTISVCENRVQGVDALLEANPAPDVVVLDDAFQHRRITPGLNILLIDYNKPIKDDYLLPLGRLRESKLQARRANIIIITKCPNEITPITRRIMAKDVHLYPYQDLYFTTMVYGQLCPVFPEGKPMDLFNDPRHMAILAVTGIAAPEYAVRHLKQITSEVDSMLYPDHHNYTEQDIRNIMERYDRLGNPKKIIVTTEKDTVRLKQMNLPPDMKKALYYLPVQVKFLDREGKQFDKRILDYVGENKSLRELKKHKSEGNSGLNKRDRTISE
ncbi:MAG: tetraacyldisaccharide 4'-kinase [Bacteroidota bacterium]